MRSVTTFSGIPSFFRACCRDASRGGGFGFDHPGRELARHVIDLSPYGYDDDEWMAEVSCLEPLVQENDDRGVVAWFVAYYPKCMALVPKRRRRSFAAGAMDSLCNLFEIEQEASQ